MKLKDVPYETDFFYKGKKWVQFIRPKMPNRKIFHIICYLKSDPCSERVEIKSNVEVKPIVSTKGGDIAA